jgi:DNA-binding LytR/AlgR family response regulator
LAAGSDSELGSSLNWTKLRDIAEAVVEEAVRASTTSAHPGNRPPLGMLLVMHPDEATKLRALLHECGAETFLASSCAEAGRVLRSGAPIRGIFSAQRLPDGGITELALTGNRCPEPAPLIVCLPQIDGGWIDLLEAGAFDLLVEPYRHERIHQIIEELSLYTTCAIRSVAGLPPSVAAQGRTSSQKR